MTKSEKLTELAYGLGYGWYPEKEFIQVFWGEPYTCALSWGSTNTDGWDIGSTAPMATWGVNTIPICTISDDLTLKRKRVYAPSLVGTHMRKTSCNNK
jgi:hypothetical protein